MVASPPPKELVASIDRRVTMHIGGWANYKTLIAMRGDAAPRITYLDGAVELMSPSFDHEKIARRICALVNAYCFARGIDVTPVGAWTLEEEPSDAAVEPDECFVFGPERRDRPDLVVEVVWTKGTLNKLEAYRRIGVPEVWWWRNDELQVYELAGDRYEPRTSSIGLPQLDMKLFVELLDVESLNEATRRMHEAARR